MGIHGKVLPLHVPLGSSITKALLFVSHPALTPLPHHDHLFWPKYSFLIFHKNDYLIKCINYIIFINVVCIDLSSLIYYNSSSFES